MGQDFRAPSPGGEQLLTLRASRTGQPVFFVHAAGGMTNIYDDLAALLPAGFPVLAIQSRVLAGAQEEWAGAKYRDLSATLRFGRDDGFVVVQTKSRSFAALQHDKRKQEQRTEAEAKKKAQRRSVGRA